MTEINRPLSLQLTSPATKTKTGPIQKPSSPTSSSSSTSSSSIASGYETPDSPSLILPYLYVGDQAQTKIDTISSLNISYVLSLQSLPKFLDTNLDTELGAQLESSDHHNHHHQQRQQQQQQQQKHKQEAEGLQGGCYHNPSSVLDAKSSDANSITKDLLPSINSSKDYLVKFQSCVNRLIKGKCINISDTFEQLVDKFFDETHNFIEEARRNKCNILVHCKAGISRSPTIAIAYLMKWKRLHLNEAYQFVKRCRPQISPNLNFMGQLINYEKQLIQRGVHQPACANLSPMLPSPALCCIPGPYLVDDHHHAPNQLDRPTYEKLPILNVIQTK